MKITVEIFHAYLKCPTKCWLRAKGEPFGGNIFPEWVKVRNDSYRTTETKRLIADVPDNKVACSPGAEKIKGVKWRLAYSVAVKAKIDSCVLETELHAIERLLAMSQGRPADFVPIRFAFANKFASDDKLLLGFDVFVMSKSLGREVGTGKIIHGDKSTALTAKTSTLWVSS